MNSRLFILFTFIVMFSGCISITPPEGWAMNEPDYPYCLRALSPEGAGLTVMVENNHDPVHGTTEYWAKVKRNYLTKEKGYSFVREGGFLCDGVPGQWLLFETEIHGTAYLFIVAVAVDGRDLFVIESGGEKEVMDGYLPAIIKSFETLDW